MEITKFGKDSLFQQIKASFLDDSIQLSSKAAAKKIILQHAFSMRLRNKYSRHQVVELLQKEYGLSQAQAYRDYSLSMQLFGDIDGTDKNAERMILAESYWQLYQMAIKDRNLEQARKALDSYKSLFNFGAEENPIDPNKIQAHEYHIHLSRSGNKILRETLRSGVVDFMSVKADDVDYEEVSDEENEDE